MDFNGSFPLFDVLKTASVCERKTRQKNYFGAIGENSSLFFFRSVKLQDLENWQKKRQRF